MSQTWHDLLFAHWPIEPQTLRPLVPAELALDIREGRCWIGVVPFHMSHIHARSLPPLPWFSRFPEMNVRTYVSVDDKPGVYFFSLDAASRLAVWAARTFYRLPYFHAEMAVGIQNNWVTYESHRHASPAEFRGRYRPSGPAQIRSTGSLEHWLTERYCLYTVTGESVYRAEVHHHPWPLQEAEAEIEINTVGSAAGIPPLNGAPLLHFSKKLEVLVWPLRRL
jgi:uncharacterized protein